MSSAISDSPPSTAHGRAEFTWEIEDFSTKTEVQRSPIFSFPANSKIWFSLECSPTVNITRQTGKFAVFNLSIDPLFQFVCWELFFKPCIRYRIAILDTNGKKYFSQECQSKFIYPNTTQLGITGGYQIQRDYLLEPANGLLNNDKLTVYCEVDDSCLKKSLAIPPNPIQDDLRSLLESGKYSDVVLLIDGKSLSVHKNILSARSDVFAAMFEHDLEEKKTNRVEISDVGVEVMELMLGYIYTGQIPELIMIKTMSDYYVTELFVAADKYQLNILKKSCENFLMRNLASSTAANILMIADMHQAIKLKEACLAYITENVKQVMPTEGWKVLLTKPDLMGELVAKMADEKDILNEKVKTLEYGVKYSLQKRVKPQISIESDSILSCKTGQNLLARNIERKFHETLFKINIESLFDNVSFSDSFLVVGDVELPVDLNILCARSKVFADLFETQTRVQLDNISVEACNELLRYIYTGQVGLKGKEFSPYLLEASHKYQLNHLKTICEQSLISSIDVDSVVDNFLLSDTNEANHLKRICFDFICDNVKQVIQTDGWQSLKQARPQFALELFEQVTEKKW